MTSFVVKSFSPQRSPQGAPAPRLPFSNPAADAGADSAITILGAGHDLSWMTAPLSPAADTLFGPRGACLFSPTGPLWVADTGHHRLLGWRSRPTTDGQPADWVIGQPDFEHEGQNAKGEPAANTVAVPTGICPCGDGMAVGDAWNHRVLIWHRVPTDSHTPADVVLGQADFTQNSPNRGEAEAASDRLHWPYGVFFHDGCLYVADTGNRRVLVWHGIPQSHGQPADQVLGQETFNTRNENGGGSPTAASMRWPHSLTLWQGHLVVADAGNNRLMIWSGVPTQNNEPCRVVLGQGNFEAVELNRGEYFPTDRSLNMPYGVTAVGDWLLTADTANSRLIGWQASALDLDTLNDAPAAGLLGQVTYRQKGENRSYGSALRDSFCWPYGIQMCASTAVIADSGNNRVMLWPLETGAAEDIHAG
ncbi:MAG: hypothetical protein F6J95_013210 [Leptolyngbya sp. SIO1E4]|nr:hypothetical protein [Leptolyngbya sp. SIO1E4]